MRIGTAIRTSAAAAAAFVAIYLVAVATATGQLVDTTLMTRAETSSPALSSWVISALGGYDETRFAVVAAAVVGLGAMTAGLRRAGCAAAVLVGITASAEALKDLLPRADLSGAAWANSYPSGHAAGIAALGAAVFVLAPPQRLAVVAKLSAIATAAMGAALVVAGWHRPSDVIGSALLATVWSCLARAVADRLPTGSPSRRRSVRGALVAA